MTFCASTAEDDIRRNINSQTYGLEGWERAGLVGFATDETAVHQNVEIDRQLGVTGLCTCRTEPYDTSNWADIERIRNDIVTGCRHIVKHVLVVSMQSFLGSTKRAIPIFAVGCCGLNALETKDMLINVARIWLKKFDGKPSLKYCRVTCWFGDPRRRTH